MSSHKPPFGQLAAEEEDRVLEHIYLSDVLDRRHERALAPHHRVILGLRGTGKTALARYLKFQSERPYNIYVSIDQRTALGRILNDVEELRERGRTPFIEDIVRIWVLAFWTALMAVLQETKQIRSVAVDKYLAVAQPRGPLGRAQVLLDGLAATLRDQGTTLLDWDRLRLLLDNSHFPSAQADTRRLLDGAFRAVIVIDSLEDLPIKSAAMRSVATALLVAANRPSREQDQLHEHVQIKCLVPTELWRAVSNELPGVGKFSPFEMTWSSSDLLRLVCRRYSHFITEARGAHSAVLPGSVTWNSPADVRSKVWGRFFPLRAEGRSGLLEDTEMLLMRHTQLRPRQLIYICNDIASRSATMFFQPNHIRDAIKSKIDDLATATFAAYRPIYEDAEELLSAHLRRRPAVFTADLLKADERFWRIAYELGVVGPVASSSSRPYDESEFLGYVKTAFNFCGTGPVNWLPVDERVAVHPMFHRRFEITETAETIVGLDSPSA